MSHKRISKPRGVAKAKESSPESPPLHELSVVSRVPDADVGFAMVGIGASAGGLEALEQFFRHAPDPCGAAFVVVQHLDPTHKGLLVELLQRVTPLKVVQICDRMRVEPNHVYVIPPNYDLSILHGVLHLLAPAAPRGLRLPIDFFLRSLAVDQQRRCMGVMLSGMGSDGTLGMAAIKEHGGTVFVQEPASAKFAAMPQSVISAGYADVVAPAEALIERIVEQHRHPMAYGESSLALSEKTHSALEKICVLLRDHSGHDFSGYKRSTLYRRIERRMGVHQLDSIVDYLRFLQESPQEATLLFKELLIGVTSFFRDPPVWEHLRDKVLPALLAGRSGQSTLRAWVAGCSTGEEAYSLAIVFKEAIAQLSPSREFKLQIFATDLDKDAIERARQSVYPPAIAADVSPERLQRFFASEERGYRVRPDLRETVVFATQNAIMDPPFTRLDVVSCRNLLIYLAPDVQKKLLPLFHYSLNPGGILLLGSAEALGGASELFAATGPKMRLYRKLAVTARTEAVDFPAAFQVRPSDIGQSMAMTRPLPNLQALADRWLLDYYAPAAVLTNRQGDILYVSGSTGDYLEPAVGKANWNIHAMARVGLRRQLSNAFQKSLRAHAAPVPIRANLTDRGVTQSVAITVVPLREPEALRGMTMVLFGEENTTRGDKPSGKRKRPSRLSPGLDVALKEVEEELQTTREEMQASQEELKSANEELQSTNEELQSTNEELTTSKEEMQSMNEELQTLNHELQAKVDELSRANDDMRNLLDSIDIATLFLDAGLKVRRYTAQMTTLIKLIPSDINRPITDLASELIYPELAADARAVLQSLVFKEKPVAATDGRWFSVRIMPYRTLDNRIDGVVITFVDISAAKALEAALRER